MVKEVSQENKQFSIYGVMKMFFHCDQNTGSQFYFREGIISNFESLLQVKVHTVSILKEGIDIRL